METTSEFAYCGLVAMSLYRLYNQPCDKDYAVGVINLLLDHRKQSKQVRDTMMTILGGIGADHTDPYVETLLQDPSLKDSCLSLLFDLLNLLIKDGCYDSRSRVLLKRMAWYLRVQWDTVEHLETTLAEDLKSKPHSISQEEETERKKTQRSRKIKRIALISLATVGGGAIIGLTGGLAAPLLAAGAGAVIGGAGATALGSVAGVAIIGSLFGVAGAGLTGYKMKRRVGATEEFEFELLTEGGQGGQTEESFPRQLHITIAITGWLNSAVTDAKNPWLELRNSHEQYSIKWESSYLIELGNALDMIMSWAVTLAAQEALRYTILSSIIAAIAWPATLVSAVGIIDNPWSVATVRAKNTGRQLADVLLTRQQGKRPVTLIGYSLGARVIFYCLEEMSKRKECEGIIEDVVMLGAPVSADVSRWRCFSRVVAGKVINGFSRGDWLLKYLYRTTSVQLSVAGLQSVRWEDRRMCNIDLSDLVSGHVDYRKKLHEILSVIGVKMAPKRGTPTKETTKLPQDVDTELAEDAVTMLTCGVDADWVNNTSSTDVKLAESDSGCSITTGSQSGLLIHSDDSENIAISDSNTKDIKNNDIDSASSITTSSPSDVLVHSDDSGNIPVSNSNTKVLLTKTGIKSDEIESISSVTTSSQSNMFNDDDNIPVTNTSILVTKTDVKSGNISSVTTDSKSNILVNNDSDHIPVPNSNTNTDVKSSGNIICSISSDNQSNNDCHHIPVSNSNVNVLHSNTDVKSDESEGICST